MVHPRQCRGYSLKGGPSNDNEAILTADMANKTTMFKAVTVDDVTVPTRRWVSLRKKYPPDGLGQYRGRDYGGE